MVMKLHFSAVRASGHIVALTSVDCLLRLEEMPANMTDQVLGNPNPCYKESAGAKFDQRL